MNCEICRLHHLSLFDVFAEGTHYSLLDYIFSQFKTNDTIFDVSLN